MSFWFLRVWIGEQKIFESLNRAAREPEWIQNIGLVDANAGWHYVVVRRRAQRRELTWNTIVQWSKAFNFLPKLFKIFRLIKPAKNYYTYVRFREQKP